jgi:hypothetical protein
MHIFPAEAEQRAARDIGIVQGSGSSEENPNTMCAAKQPISSLDTAAGRQTKKGSSWAFPQQLVYCCRAISGKK